MGLMQQMDPHFRQHPIRNTATVIVAQDGTNRRLYLPTSAAEDKHIFGIDVRRKGAAGKASTGATLAADAVIDGSFITIKSGQSDTLRDYPVAKLSSKADGGADSQKYTQVSLPGGYVPATSYIQIADGVGMTAADVFEITFHFLFPNDCETNPL